MFTGSHDEMKASPSFSITEKIEDFIHSLKDKHGETHQPDVGRQLLLFLKSGLLAFNILQR